MIETTPEQIDRAARYLRETKQAHQGLLVPLKPWNTLPKSAKRKWLVLAEGTLRAAQKDHDNG